MSRSTVIRSNVLVPASVLISAVGITFWVCRFIYGHEADTASIKAQVEALDRRVTVAETRLDKSDARWDQIRDDLAAIKERLGIVEATKK